MIRNDRIIRAILLFIPVLSVIWSLVLNHLSGPHYLSRTDPEYVYLLNGMNVSLLEFDRIGHVDHPGTPFQLITGLFMTLGYDSCADYGEYCVELDCCGDMVCRFDQTAGYRCRD